VPEVTLIGGHHDGLRISVEKREPLNVAVAMGDHYVQETYWPRVVALRSEFRVAWFHESSKPGDVSWDKAWQCGARLHVDEIEAA
jgi:hypothetical protein